MINNTIGKTVGMLQGLTEKIINLIQKTDQYSLLNQDYTELNNKINILSGLFQQNQDNNENQENNNNNPSSPGNNTQTTDILFTVTECSTEKANGSYWLTNEGSDGYNRIFTNGSVYCIGYTEMYDVNIPEAGYSIIAWYICDGFSYNNRGTIYAMTYTHESLTANPWDCHFVDDLTGYGITVTANQQQSGSKDSTQENENSNPQNSFTVSGYTGPDPYINGIYTAYSGEFGRLSTIYKTDKDRYCWYDRSNLTWCFNEFLADSYINTLAYDTTYGGYSNPWDVPASAWSYGTMYVEKQEI